MATPVITITRPHALRTIAGGGLLAGLLDGSHAVLYNGLMYGISAPKIFRYIASGLIGVHAAAHAGWFGIALGVAIHFSIALSAATAYYFAALRLPILIRRPVLSGTFFGLIVYVVMFYAVIPLSFVPKNSHASFSVVNFISEILAHVFLVGIPIALMARWSARVKVAGIGDSYHAV